MRLDLAERLRCPADHVPTPLIVVARATRDRELLEGFAGCPVCHLEARVRAGDVEFPSGDADVRHGDDAAVGEAAPRTVMAVEEWMPDVGRLQALLGLDEPGGAVLLVGRYAALGPALAARADVAVVTVGPRVPVPPAVPGAPAEAHGVSAVRGTPGRVPFADATFRGAALDAGVAPGLAEEAVRTVGVGGRLVGAAALARPAGTNELARDAHEWVAARETLPQAVPLRRRRD